MDAESDLLCSVGSYGDPLNDENVLARPSSMEQQSRERSLVVTTYRLLGFAERAMLLFVSLRTGEHQWIAAMILTTFRSPFS
jgi:hypothetical protein